jgi:hypothetical protein
MSQEQILIKIEQNEAQLRKLMQSVLTKYQKVSFNITININSIRARIGGLCKIELI